MSRLLVVGATGQLGSEVVRQAAALGLPVRALVRRSSRHLHLETNGVELAYGDLKDAESLKEACAGVTAVVSTATVVFPQGRYSFEEDEGKGYTNLVEACRQQGVQQLLFTSIAVPFSASNLRRVPSLRFKAACEKLIRESGVPYTIFRCTPFMDDYFALMGSSIPLRGEVCATLNRSRGLTRLTRRLLGTTIEQWGVALVPGPSAARHAFIAVKDVAAYLVAAIGASHAYNATFEVGGPHSISWQDVAEIYAELLGRRVLALSTPVGMYRTLARASQPWSQAFSNQMALLRALGEHETRVDSRDVAQRFGVSLTSAETYLSEKVHAGR